METDIRPSWWRGELPAYYETLLYYIHLNPGRAGLVRVKEGKSILDYPWSSVAGGYALSPGKRAKWLAAEDGFRAMGLPDTVAGRKQVVAYLDRRSLEEGRKCGLVPVTPGTDRRMSHLRKGWYWGRQEFAERMLKLGEKLIRKGKSRAYNRSLQKVDHGLNQAEHWIREGLKIAGIASTELDQLKGTDPRKAALAKLVWDKTTVSQDWIAKRLKMKGAGNVCQVLRRMDEKAHRKVPAHLRNFILQQLREK